MVYRWGIFCPTLKIYDNAKIQSDRKESLQGRDTKQGQVFMKLIIETAVPFLKIPCKSIFFLFVLFNIV